MNNPSVTLIYPSIDSTNFISSAYRYFVENILEVTANLNFMISTDTTRRLLSPKLISPVILEEMLSACGYHVISANATDETQLNQIVVTLANLVVSDTMPECTLDTAVTTLCDQYMSVVDSTIDYIISNHRHVNINITAVHKNIPTEYAVVSATTVNKIPMVAYHGDKRLIEWSLRFNGEEHAVTQQYLQQRAAEVRASVGRYIPDTYLFDTE